MDKTKQTAVAIGSGGIRSIAALPLLRYLQDEDIAIDLLVCSGGGAIVSSLFALGCSDEEIVIHCLKLFNKKLYNHIDYKMFARACGIPFKESPKYETPYLGKPFYNALKEVFKDFTIQDLPYRLNAIATDIQTGESVTLEKGLLADCLYASNCVYPFIPPIEVDNKFLVSGVFTSSLPMMTAVKEGMDTIFAIDFTGDESINSKSMQEYICNFLNRSCTIMQRRQTALSVNLHDGDSLVMNVDCDEWVGLFAIEKVDKIIEAGKRTFATYKDEIDRLIFI